MFFNKTKFREEQKVLKARSHLHLVTFETSKMTQFVGL